jgi:NitT/TauT family transport system ATP-binding protein
VTLPLEFSAEEHADGAERAHELLETVGLAHLAEQFPHRLTPGQFERLGIARALASDPEVLLMDEPFSAVDRSERVDLLERVLKIKEQTGITMIFATHRADDAICIADRVFLLGGHPTHILDEVSIDLQKPRSIQSAGCSDLATTLSERLHHLEQNA